MGVGEETNLILWDEFQRRKCVFSFAWWKHHTQNSFTAESESDRYMASFMALHPRKIHPTKFRENVSRKKTQRQRREMREWKMGEMESRQCLLKPECFFFVFLFFFSFAIQENK